MGIKEEFTLSIHTKDYSLIMAIKVINIIKIIIKKRWVNKTWLNWRWIWKLESWISKVAIGNKLGHKTREEK